MRKQILTVVLVLGTLATSNAFASRARDLVLGTGDGGVVLGNGGSSGTFYTDDAYNMFYNPAYVNDYKNWAIIEKSNFENSGTQTVATTPATAGQTNGTTAQGGFVTGIGNFSLLLFFNRQDDLQDAAYTNQSNMRPVDVIFGGDMNNLKWGLGVTYASSSATGGTASSGATATSSDWVIHAGVSYMDIEPFINWRVSGTDNAIGSAPTNKGGEIGLRYHWGEWTPYGVYKYEQYAGNTDYRAFGVGLGRTMKATEAVKLAYSIAYFRQSMGVNNGTIGAWNGTSTAGDRSVIPLNVSIEGDANSWLTLRAGLGYNFEDRVNNVTVADNTTARIGATAHAGKVDFDFAVGAGGTGAENPGATNTQNFDFTSGVFTAASVQYHW